jgi:uncharacterized damage-inducible protein DinB
MREWLIDGFGYDRWANLKWVEALTAIDPVVTSAETFARAAAPGPWPDFPHGPTRAQEIFLHLIWAQRIWLERCGCSVAPDGADATEWIEALHDAWIRELRDQDPEERIAYQNFSGQANERSRCEIALHVINHGTYHRGQIREAVDGAGVEIPLTDLAAYFAVR